MFFIDLITSNWRDRLVGVLFLGLFAGYGFLAQDIQLDLWATEDLFNARTFPEFIAVGGMLVSGLFVLFPGRPSNLDLPTLNPGPAVALLAALTVYGFIITPLGFLLSTIGLLAAGTLILGERRWWLILSASISIPVIFQGLMLLLGIQLEPGLLGFLHD